MIIGVPKEIKIQEYRVACAPAGVRALLASGHRVLVERGAGLGSGITDEQYRASGAELVTREQAWEADLIVKVKEPIAEEFAFFRPGLTIFTYLHLAAARELAFSLKENKVTAVAYETIQTAGGKLPLLVPMSEVAGRMAVQAGAHFLEGPNGGRGVLLGGAPGVRRGKVAIIGGGTVGMASAKIAVGMGADVVLLDIDSEKMNYLDDIYGSRITTLASLPDTIASVAAESDLLIGAVLIPGAKAPSLVSEEMVTSMNPGSVIVDVSIDQGGCVETMHPTSHENPVFVRHGVLHYGVTNMPGAVGRTSTFALTNLTLGYLLKLAGGPLAAAAKDPALAQGFNLHSGSFTHPNVAAALGEDCVPISEYLA